MTNVLFAMGILKCQKSEKYGLNAMFTSNGRIFYAQIILELDVTFMI